jgi:hypothetical protein
MTQRVNRLLEALKLLALPAQRQQEYLRSLGVPEVVDELALEFHDIAPAAPDMVQKGEIDEREFRAIQNVDDLLVRMSGAHNKHLWSLQGLQQATEWLQVRDAAQVAIHSLQRDTP